MATTGAFNGTDVFLRVNDGVDWLSVGGQLSHTETLNNNPIEITEKTIDPSFRRLLSGEGLQTVDYSVELNFVSQAGYDFVRALAGNKGQALFQVVHTDIPSGGVPIELTLQVNSFVDTSEDGGALKGVVTLMSSDEFDFNLDATYEAFVVTDPGNFLTANGDIFFVRAP